MPHLCTNCDRTFPDGSKEMLSGCPGCGGNKFQFTPAADRTRAAEPGTREPTTGTDSTVGTEPTRDREDSLPASSEHDPSSGPVDGPHSPSASTSGSDHWPETAQRPAERGIEADEWEDRSHDATATVGNSPPRTTPSRDERDATDHVDTDGDAERSGELEREDDAQASARSDVISPDELPPRGSIDSDDADRQHGSQPTSERPAPTGTVVSEPETERPSLEELREELNDQFESIKIVNPGQYELNLMELYDREEHIISLQEDGRYVINVPDTWYETDE